MQIVFDKTQANIVFVHESGDEYKWLCNFPAFEKTALYHTVPAILPVAHNVIERIRRSKKTLKFDPRVLEWLDSDFKLKPLPASFKFHTSPKDFQEIALRYLYTLGSAGILLDPGMGKSKVVLDYIHLMSFKRVIIICPRALLFVWEDEIQKHRPELSYHTVLTTDFEQEKVAILKAQVTIINYDKVSILQNQLKQIPFEFIHADEFLIKDPSTARTQSITKLSKGISYRCGGSGTLINNSPLDGFSPLRYLQPALVGWNYTNFLNKYTVQQKLKNSERKVIVAVKGQDEIRSMLDSCCIIMTKEKWLKLPPKTFKDSIVTMTDEQREAYYGLMRNYYVNISGNDVYVDNPLVMLSKLYQISNGFIYLNNDEQDDLEEILTLYDENGETGKSKTKNKKKKPRQTYFFPDNPKIAQLEVLLTRTLVGKKAIIWFNYEGEYIQIQQLLDRLGHSHLVIRGGEKEIGNKVRSFNKDPSIQWLVCQAQSVNYGITVMGSKRVDLEKEGIEVLPDIDTAVYTEVFFSLSFSLERYLQQIDRVHRLGQEHECTYYRLFTNAPIEYKIRDTIEQKVTIKEEMLVDVVESMLNEIQ